MPGEHDGRIVHRTREGARCRKYVHKGIWGLVIAGECHHLKTVTTSNDKVFS